MDLPIYTFVAKVFKVSFYFHFFMCWFYYQLEAETLPFLGIIEKCNLVCIFLNIINLIFNYLCLLPINRTLRKC